MMKLTKSDQAILESYKIVLKGLASLFGSNCEFVLHSLENLEKAIIAIENSHLSGRSVNGPATNVALSFINDPKYENRVLNPYITKTKFGHNCKSVTIPIRNGEKLLGFLCINLNVEMPVSDLLKVFSVVDAPHIGDDSISEIFEQDFDSLVQQMIVSAINKVNDEDGIKSKDINRKVVEELESKGFFNLKGSVKMLKDALKISNNTIYLYIREKSKFNSFKQFQKENFL